MSHARSYRRAILVTLALAIPSAIIGPTVATAATPDFVNNLPANVAAVQVAEQLTESVKNDKSYVGVRIVAGGVEVSFTSAPTPTQVGTIKAIRAGEAALLNSMPLDSRSHVDVPILTRIVSTSTETLEQLSKQIETDRQSWADKGIDITAWGPDVATNSVTLSLLKYDSGAASQLVDYYGSALTVLNQSVDPSISSRTADSAPWFGADLITRRIDATHTELCTSWFSTTNSLGHDISATSAHCGRGDWKQNNQTFGTTSGLQLGGSADFQGIPVSGGNLEFIWSDPTSLSRHVFKVATSDPVPFLVCTDGQANREVCNVVASKANQNVYFKELNKTITGLVYAYQKDGIPAFTRGDSGGPVEQTLGSQSAQAFGMIEGVLGPDSAGWYIPARTVDSALSLTIKK